jgi:hypothetical protein
MSKGQIVVPDYGPYATEADVSLLGRLTAGVNTLDELPPKLRQRMLLGETEASGATFEDAELLAKYALLPKGTNKWNDEVDAAMK